MTASIEHPCLILYRSATGLERALVDIGGGRLIAMNAEAVRSMWNPWEISAENLPTLAWAMQAQLWDDDWSDSTKREWIARQWEYQALRGTRAGVEMALKFMGRDFNTCGGYELNDILVPPQGFFASPDIPKEQWDEWIRQMPQLRIQLARKTGVADGEWYVLDSFVGENHAGVNDGGQLYGRRVILRWPGRPDVDLGMLEADETGKAERISLPGLAGAAFIANEDFVTDSRFVDGEQIAPTIYTFQLDPTYDHLTSLLHLSTITSGLVPLNVQFERDSDTGWGDHFWFVNDYVPEYFADSGRDAAELLADRVYLLDPNVATPMTQGISFAGVDRVDWPPFNAELLINLCTREPGPAWIANETAAEESFAIPDDWTDFDRAMRALKGPGASTALRDKIMADFDAMHPLRMGEPIYINPDTRFGDHRPSWL